MSLFDKLKKGLVKTRSGIVNSIKGLLKSFKKIDEELFDEIEEILISSAFVYSSKPHQYSNCF